MSRLTERLLEHPAHESLEAAKAALDALDDEQREASESHLEDAVGRADKVIAYVQGVLETVDATLVVEGELNGIQNNADALTTAVSNLQTDPAQAQAVDQAAEGLLGATVPLASRSRVPADVAEDVREAVGAVIRARVQELGEEARALGEQLEEIERKGEALANETEQAGGQRQTELQTKLDELSGSVDTEKQRLDELVPNFEGQFQEAQGQREEQWNETRSELKTSARETIAGVEEKAAEAKAQLEESSGAVATDLREKADELLGYLGDKRNEFEELYRTLTDTGVSGGFDNEAAEQREVADTWRLGAVVGGAITTLIAIGAVAFAALADVSASTHIAALAVAAAAGGITAYAARQSGHHRDREVESKRLALELAAFGPFVEGMSDEQEDAPKVRNEIRKQYIERMFKGAERSTSPEEATISKDQVSLLQSLIEAVLKVRS